ncbi:MAG: metalloregulator ArsR/SmtB family transcription factor [Actinomycetota bacterium]|nr:metalloregulator ArsR/SmtB family transcription factor [Actinomycetota bacterium]
MPNQLVQTELAAIFKALADPTRLAVVERLSIGPASATELARPFEMALPSFMQHLAVLEAAGIVTSHKAGRTRTFQLAPGALGTATTWLGTHRNHWHRRLDQLDQLLTEPPPEPSPEPSPEPQPDPEQEPR